MEASKPEMQEGHAGSTSHTAVRMQEDAIRRTKTTSQMRLETLAQEKAGELWEILETNVEHSDANESGKGREGTSQQEGEEEGCEADERLAAILQLQLVQQKQEMMAIEEAHAVTNADALFRRGLEELIGEHLNTCMEAAAGEAFTQRFCLERSPSPREQDMTLEGVSLEGFVCEDSGDIVGTGVRSVSNLETFSPDNGQGKDAGGPSAEGSGNLERSEGLGIGKSNGLSRHNRSYSGGEEEEEEGRLLTRRRPGRSQGFDTMSRDAELVALARMQAVSTMLDASFLQDEPAASSSRRHLDFEPYMQRAHLEALQRWRGIEIQRHLEMEELHNRARLRGVVRRRPDSDTASEGNRDSQTCAERRAQPGDGREPNSIGQGRLDGVVRNTSGEAASDSGGEKDVSLAAAAEPLSREGGYRPNTPGSSAEPGCDSMHKQRSEMEDPQVGDPQESMTVNPEVGHNPSLTIGSDVVSNHTSLQQDTHDSSNLTSINGPGTPFQNPGTLDGPDTPLQISETSALSVSEMVRLRESARARADEGAQREQQMLRRRAQQRDRFLELEAAWEQERERELAGLGQQRAVSEFAHRTRLQSLFRGRFLRQGASASDNAPHSHTPPARVEEMGFLRERRPVSGIRELFRHNLENIVRRQASGEGQNRTPRVSEGLEGNGAGLRRNGEQEREGGSLRRQNGGVPVGQASQERWVDEASVYNMELQELLTRRSVSTILTSEFRNRLEELVNSLVLTRVGTTAHQPLNQQFAAQQAAPQGQRAAAPPAPPPMPQGPLWQPAQVAASAPARWHTGSTSGYDMRESVRQLQHEMEQMRRLMQNCFEMQLELQRSIRQEVAGALQRVSGAGRQPSEGQVDGSKWAAIKRGVCCVCCESPIDSLLYRCGHMCACHKCARQLQQTTETCPLCRAPIVEVVRAFTTA